MSTKIRSLSLVYWLALLALILAWLGWRQFGTKQFNADGAEFSPFSFSYPANWDGVYPGGEDSVTILHDDRDQYFENGIPHGFAQDKSAVFIVILSPDKLEAEYGNSQVTPLEILNQRKAENDVLWEAWNTGDVEKVERLLGYKITPPEDTALWSPLSAPSITMYLAIDDPHLRQISEREIAVTKQQGYSTFIMLSSASKKLDAIFVLNGQVIHVIGLYGIMDDEDFEKDFYQIIGSLELVDSE